MTPLLLLFTILLCLKVLGDLTLDFLNLRLVREQRNAVPEPLADFVDLETHQRSADYTLAKGRFGMLESLFSAVLLAVVVLSGFLPWLFAVFTDLLGTGVWAQGFSLILVFFVLSLPGLPLDWWSTFRIEERFGFNKSTFRLWVSDKLKGGLVSIVLLLPLLALLVALVQWFPATWWAWGFVAFFGFQLVMTVLYPMYIMPLFNKLEPMEDGSLKDRLFDLADKTGFQAKTILVMDGSKRSGHSNAFFAGFGRFRRIVLFDTLIEQLDEAELEAVLAHEIGHYKLGHIPKMLIISALSSFGIFALLGWLSAGDWFLRGFGFGPETAELIAPLLLLFMLLSGLVGFWLSPLMNARSRKHEYEADAFAREAIKGSGPMVGALRKLHKENLGNSTPHPLYSAFHYSHPAMVERLGALENEVSPHA